MSVSPIHTTLKLIQQVPNSGNFNFLLLIAMLNQANEPSPTTQFKTRPGIPTELLVDRGAKVVDFNNHDFEESRLTPR